MNLDTTRLQASVIALEATCAKLNEQADRTLKLAEALAAENAALKTEIERMSGITHLEQINDALIAENDALKADAERLRALLLNSFGLDVTETPEQVRQVDALFADAKRYRWMKETQAWWMLPHLRCTGEYHNPADVFDGAVDAAMKEQTK